VVATGAAEGVSAALVAFLATLGAEGVAEAAAEGAVTLSVEVLVALTILGYYMILMQLFFKLFNIKYIIL
jgi:hypothetical protein